MNLLLLVNYSTENAGLSIRRFTNQAVTVGLNWISNMHDLCYQLLLWKMTLQNLVMEYICLDSKQFELTIGGTCQLLYSPMLSFLRWGKEGFHNIISLVALVLGFTQI